MASTASPPALGLKSLAARLRGGSRNAAAVAAVAVLFAELLLFGGDRQEVALAFTVVQTLGLALLLTATRWAPEALSSCRALRPLYLLFPALLVSIAAQFAPFPAGMARDAWTAAGAAPAITIDKFATLVEMLKLLGLGAVFVTGAVVGFGRQRAQAAFVALAVMGAAYAGWALAGFYFRGAGGAIVEGGRLSASLLSPNTAAAALGLAATASWTAALLAVRSALEASDAPRERLVRAVALGAPWVVLVFLSLWAIALTGSRGGLLSTLAGLGVSAAVAALARSPQGRASDVKSTIAAAAAGLLAVLVIFVVAQGPFAARLGAYQAGVTDRTAYIQLYLGHLRDIPWTGLGLGSFSRFNPLMLGSDAPARFWEFGAMHNVYLQWIYEGGVVGAALMFACVAWSLAVVGGAVRRSGASRPWLATALGTSTMIAAHGMVDFDLQIHAIAALWAFVLGAGAGAAQRDRR